MTALLLGLLLVTVVSSLLLWALETTETPQRGTETIPGVPHRTRPHPRGRLPPGGHHRPPQPRPGRPRRPVLLPAGRRGQGRHGSPGPARGLRPRRPAAINARSEDVAAANRARGEH